MKINREKFLSALLAAGMGSAVACGGEPPPAAEAEPMETSGEEMPAEEPMEEPAAEAPAEEPAPEPEPEVEEAGPTPE